VLADDIRPYPWGPKRQQRQHYIERRPSARRPLFSQITPNMDALRTPAHMHFSVGAVSNGASEGTAAQPCREKRPMEG
jgi:hypothetical protein